MQESFVFMASFYDAIKDLDDAHRLEVYDALAMYGTTGKLPENLSGTASFGIKLMVPVIDSNKAKRDKRKEAGSKGGTSGSKSEAKGSKSEANGSKQEASGSLEVEVDVEDEVDVEVDVDAEDEYSFLLDAASHTEPEVFIEIPLIDGTFFKVTREYVDKMQKLFPATDAEQEFRNIYSWNDSRPKHRKTSRGIAAHINSWFNKAQNSYHPSTGKPAQKQAAKSFLEIAESMGDG